jgi:hypothetical protein
LLHDQVAFDAVGRRRHRGSIFRFYHLPCPFARFPDGHYRNDPTVPRAPRRRPGPQ